MSREELKARGLDAVLARIAKRHHVTPELIIDSAPVRGTTQIAQARAEFWSVLIESGLGYAEIGRLLNRHHTSIMHGVRRNKEAMSKESKTVVREVEFDAEEDAKLRALAKARGMTVGEVLRAFARACQPGGSGWKHPMEPVKKKLSVPPKVE